MESEHTTSSMSQDIGKFAENAGVTRPYMVINTALKFKNGWKTIGDWWNWNVNGTQKWKLKRQCRQKQLTK